MLSTLAIFCVLRRAYETVGFRNINIPSYYHVIIIAPLMPLREHLHALATLRSESCLFATFALYSRIKFVPIVDFCDLIICCQG